MNRPVLVVRPRRLRRVCIVVAAVVVLAAGGVALVLKRSSIGVDFDTADQLAVFGIGLVLAMAVLAAARPMIWADTNGVTVRNLIGERHVPWDVVREVRFPDRSLWAHLDLLDDETVTLLALQSVDGDDTVAALDSLRRLHRGDEPSG